MKRRALFAGLLAAFFIALPAVAAPARHALPPPAPEIPYMPIFCAPRAISTKFGAWDGVHTARRGELIVPPRQYASGLHSPLAPGADDSGIYDIAFLGIDSEGVMLELRDYPAPGAPQPTATRTFSYPAGTRSIQLRHIVLSVRRVSDQSIVYIASIAPAVADDDAAVSEEASDTQEVVANDYCRMSGVPPIDVARPR